MSISCSVKPSSIRSSGRARKLCSRFLREWHALSCAYGESREGCDYRAALTASPAISATFADRIVLRNRAMFLNSITLMVLRVALADRPMPARRNTAPHTPGARRRRASAPTRSRGPCLSSPRRARVEPAVRDAGQGAEPVRSAAKAMRYSKACRSSTSRTPCVVEPARCAAASRSRRRAARPLSPAPGQSGQASRSPSRCACWKRRRRTRCASRSSSMCFHKRTLFICTATCAKRLRA